jgi:hypothetical protein
MSIPVCAHHFKSQIPVPLLVTILQKPFILCYRACFLPYCSSYGNCLILPVLLRSVLRGRSRIISLLEPEPHQSEKILHLALLWYKPREESRSLSRIILYSRNRNTDSDYLRYCWKCRYRIQLQYCLAHFDDIASIDIVIRILLWLPVRN